MGRSINKLHNKKGFTLIELIVVLAVLAIIMAIAVPRFKGVREQAKIDSDYAVLESIAKLAEFEYVRENGEVNDPLTVDDLTTLIDDNFGESNDIFQSKFLIGKQFDLIVNYTDNGYVEDILVGAQEVYPVKIGLEIEPIE